MQHGFLCFGGIWLFGVGSATALCWLQNGLECAAHAEFLAHAHLLAVYIHYSEIGMHP